MNGHKKLCICLQCTGPNEITCNVNNSFPEWLKFAPYYERVVENNELWGPPQRLSNFKQYISLIQTEMDENREEISRSNVLAGRMSSKVFIIDVLENKEVEVTLDPSNELDPICWTALPSLLETGIQDDQITGEQLCKLWPNNFILINQQWAVFLLSKNRSSEARMWSALLLVEIDYKTGKFTPKDSLIFWNDPSSDIFVETFKHLIGNQSDAPFFCMILRDIHRNHELNRSLLTLFISVDLCTQKLLVLKEIPGRILNLGNLYLAAFANHKIYQFVTESVNRMDISIFLHFDQMKIYNLDEPEKGLQLKELTLPTGYEHEFVPRRPVKPDLVHVVWSYDYVTLCLSARPPFYNVTNTFMLNLSTLKWRRLQLPDYETTPWPNLRHHCNIFYRFRWFFNDVLLVSCNHEFFDDSGKRLAVRRWYRAHVRRPSSLFELTWFRAICSNQHWRLEKLSLNSL